MAYIGAPPQNRVLSSDDIAQGAVTLNDINFTDQPTNMDITGVIDKHTMRLADGVTITGDVTISDDLVLSKISDDGNAITMTNDGSSRTITGSGSIEASTLSQTPNQSLTGMTGTVGSAVTNNAGVASGVIGSAVTGSPALNLGNATFPAGHILQVESTTLATGYTASNSGFTDITGLSVAITPKFSNSKVLVLVNMCITASNDHHARIVRDSTAIAVGTGQGSLQVSNTFGYIYESGASRIETRSASYLDSPATTSATTYKVQAGGTSAVFVNRASGDINNAVYGRQVSTITVMEVAQ